MNSQSKWLHSRARQLKVSGHGPRWWGWAPALVGSCTIGHLHWAAGGRNWGLPTQLAQTVPCTKVGAAFLESDHQKNSHGRPSREKRFHGMDQNAMLGPKGLLKFILIGVKEKTLHWLWHHRGDRSIININHHCKYCLCIQPLPRSQSVSLPR